MKQFLYLLIFLIITGCATPVQKLDPKIYYKRDMQLNVNGHQGEGVLVVPYSESYDFDIKSPGKLDLFTFKTCHREQTKEKAGGKGWFRDSHRRKFTFKPTPLESEGVSCPALIGGYAIKGKHSQAFVDFEHPSLTLPALLSCNGSQYNTTGVSVCQTRVGLLQEIKFPEPVLAAIEGTCIKMVSKDDKTFRFKMPKKECLFKFVTKSGDEKWHRLTTIGYEAIPIRGK